MIQRMRGVQQLGLAHLVIPGAIYDRFEHTIGVVGATEHMVSAHNRQIDRWNNGRGTTEFPLDGIGNNDRFQLRLAAFFHDLGHGPFSHAIEPVLEVASPRGEEEAKPAVGWRADIVAVGKFLKTEYLLNASPSVSEIISVMIIMSSQS